MINENYHNILSPISFQEIPIDIENGINFLSKINQYNIFNR
jgi:hypothetical protein